VSQPTPVNPRSLPWALASSALLVLAVVAGVFHLTAPRVPEGAGEVGRVTVYGQVPAGPLALLPGARRRLPRPQELAFFVEVEGRGPRVVRLEVEGSDHPVLLEQRLEAPFEAYLDYTLTLDESAPDELVLVATVEAPGQPSAVVRHPIALVGKETRFWSAAPDAGGAR
jgi:hypothetical protein